MIATLTGKVIEKLGELVVIDVSGVGYGVLMSVEDQATCQTGSKISVYIYEAIRENSHDLFGFMARSTKDLFELLLSVNGVGPKGALAIINLGSESGLRAAIASGDTKFISGATGIGKKVAERVVVDLKDKVGLVSSAEGIFQGQAAASSDEAVQALISLGYTTTDAIIALQTIDSNLPTEQRIKQALKVGK